ncbi:MAG: hypothetical protein ABIG63_14995, partial [Chloroflexota bacterium]
MPMTKNYTKSISNLAPLRNTSAGGQSRISRRTFLKLAALGLGGLALRPWRQFFDLPDFPQSERLGRVCEGKVDLKSKPDYDSPSVGTLFQDAVVPWLQETVGRWPWRNNQRWVETPDGYIWSPYLQPVENHPAEPVDALPQLGDEPGMWVEVCAPYVDAVIANPPARSSWLRYRLENNLIPRFYYSQIFWCDQIKTEDDGSVWYRLNDRYGSPGDIFWARAEALR